MSAAGRPPAPTGAGATEDGYTEAVVWALLALALGYFAAAVISFRESASLGVKAGRLLLALAPWILVLRVGRSPDPRPWAGVVSSGWVFLLGGALTPLTRVAEAGDPLLAATYGLEAAGAAAVLWSLYRGGRFGGLGLALRWLLGLGLAGAVFAARALPDVERAAYQVGLVLAGLYLVPQLARDAAVVRAARRTGRWAAARRGLAAIGTPFLLWSLAGQLVLAPSTLFWSPKPNVFFAGVSAAVLLALFALRGLAGVFARRAALGLVVVCVAYGVGLAVLVTGQRPYTPPPGVETGAGDAPGDRG